LRQVVLLPASDGIATEGQLDALLSVVRRVVAGRGQTRSDPPTELDEAVDTAVCLLARDAERARLGLAERLLRAKRN
jgi:hypothetical protein